MNIQALQNYHTALGQDMAAMGHTVMFNDTMGEFTGIDAIHLEQSGVIPWRAPASADPTNNANEIHKAAVIARTLAVAVADTNRIKRDARLSDAAKAADANAIWAKAKADLDRAFQEATAENRKLVEYERTFYTSPKVTDPVEQLADMEARTWLIAQDRDQLSGLLDRMTRGELPGLLQAAIRSPFPLPFGLDVPVRNAWNAKIARDQPDMLQAVKDRRERMDWLLMIAEHCALIAYSKTDNKPLQNAAVRRVA